MNQCAKDAQKITAKVLGHIRHIAFFLEESPVLNEHGVFERRWDVLAILEAIRAQADLAKEKLLSVKVWPDAGDYDTPP